MQLLSHKVMRFQIWHGYISDKLDFLRKIHNWRIIKHLRQNESPVWPDWAIYWTLGNFLKPLATINLPKSPTFLGNFCEVVKINHFWATFIDIWRFFFGHTEWDIGKWCIAATVLAWAIPKEYQSHRLQSRILTYFG